MTNFIIEKGIPLKVKIRKKYPFPDMEVGDSFIFSEIYSRKSMQYGLVAARGWAKGRNNGWKFSARKTDDNKVRIWRVK